MLKSPAQARPVRFGAFELDLSAGGLRKDGAKVKLQDQPLQILALLVEHPGQLVSRDELRKHLWPEDTFVDFDHSLNKAVNKLRDALNDSAENPLFIETIPKRGYRFIADIAQVKSAQPMLQPGVPDTSLNRQRILAAALLVLLCTAALLWIKNRYPFLTSAASPSIHTVAVLPLQNLSNDPAQEYFSDGMTDALITDLAQVSSLKVISRTSSMQYRHSTKSLPQIARELNADAIIEGTVQRFGDRVRINAQLIHGPSDKHLWAQTYDRDMRDSLQVQKEIASDAVAGITSQLGSTPAATRPSGGPYSLNTAAYDDYLKGRNLVRHHAQDDVLKGLDFLQHSVATDPNFALAHSEISHAYQMLAELNRQPPSEVIPKAKAASIRALTLDPNLAEAHVSLSSILGEYNWDWDGELRELQRALELDPNSVLAHENYAVYLLIQKRNSDAIREIQTALELDPFSPPVHSTACYIYRVAHQYDLSLREGRRTIAIDPSYPIGHNNLAATLAATGKQDEAFLEWLQYLRLDGDEALAAKLDAEVKKLSGPGDPGARLAHISLKYYLDKMKTRYVGALTVAEIYIDLADKDKMFEWLNKACDEHSVGVYDIAIEPPSESVRSDPRYRDLLRRMNLTKALHEDTQPSVGKTVSIPALEAYIQGHYHADLAAGLAYRNGMDAAQRKELDTARQFFQKSIQHDPSYAQAYVGLAHTWGEQPVSEDGPANAEAFVRKAIQLEPDLAEAHEALATLDVLRLWRWQEAEQEYRRAIEINPNFAEAHARYAEYLDCMKRFDEGLHEFLRAQQLDPGHNFEPNPLLRRRQLQQAIELDEGKVQRGELGFFSHQDLAFDYSAAGRHEDAAKQFEEMLRSLDYVDLADGMRKGREQSGYKGAYRALLAGLEAVDARGDPVPAFFPAIFYGQLGDRNRAFYWLERGYKERSPAYSALNVDPYWDPLRDDPRFKDLVRRVGLRH